MRLNQRWPVVGLLAFALFLSLTADFSPVGQANGADNTKIIDPGTQFHRLYVLGNGNNSFFFSEDNSFRNDVDQLIAAFRTGRNTANRREADDSTHTLLTRPNINQLQTALNALAAAAGAGDEITLVFKGHGGGGTTYGSKDNVEANETDHYDEHFGLSAGVSLFDDGSDDAGANPGNLPAMLTAAGIPGASETLVIIFDSCYGGGFAGGDNDLEENQNVKIIGPRGLTYIDPPKPLSIIRKSFSEYIVDGVNQDSDRTMSGDDMKTYLGGQGVVLGQPTGTEQGKKGKSQCDTCGEVGCASGEDLPSLGAQPQTGPAGFTAKLTGQNFGANASVTLSLLKPDETLLALGSASTDAQRTFTKQVAMPDAAGLYLVSAIDDQGFDDWALLSVGSGPASVGGVPVSGELAGLPAETPDSSSGGASVVGWVIAGATAGAVALGAAWYGRRRLR